MEIINLVARDLPDCWYQCIYNILEKGHVFTIDSGSFKKQKRLEFDYINVLIKNPETRPLLPKIEPQYQIPDPVSEEYLNSYISYIFEDNKQPDEDYTYGQRLVNYSINSLNSDCTGFNKFELNQVETIIQRYKKYGFRNNQLVLQISQPQDLLLDDPPCLRHIDTRIQEGMLHFFIYFRSWDLWSGLPANLAGIQYLKEYMADEIGVKPGISYISSKGMHIYDYCFDYAKCLRNNSDIILKEGE